MERARCRGCIEPGWQGLRSGYNGQRYHERTIAPGELEMIPCVADMKKPTKIMSANTGLFTCQICDHEYEDPRK